MLRLIIASAAAAAVLAGAAFAADRFPPSDSVRSMSACDAKWLLSGHNEFKIKTYDREWVRTKQGCTWGDAAKASTRKMKWKLGYPPAWLNGVFGPNLYEFLTGQRKLPPLFAKRRADRSPVIVLKQSYPLRNRGAMCGWPGGGTHSFWAYPNNWMSDAAIDICVAEGTPILAVRSGTICRSLGRISTGSGRFAGIRFYLCDDVGRQWFYHHTKAVFVKLGQKVQAGQVIALVGVAGIAHLHLSCDSASCRSQRWWGDFLGIKGV